MSFRVLRLIFIFCLLITIGLLGCATSGLSVGLEPTATPSPTSVPLLTATLSRPPLTQSLASPTSTPTTLSPPLPGPSRTARPTPTSTLALTPAEKLPVAHKIEHVVIISIDGLRPEALAQTDTPVFDALRAKGAYSPMAQAVTPSVTLVNHASMLSGMSPAKHGIYWNETSPDLGKINGPTLFRVAHEAGLSTAMIVGKPKLEHLVLPDSVDNYVYAGFTDQQVTDQALEIIQAGLPALLFIHLPDVDSAGHALGWLSPGQLMALNATDGLIGQVVAELEAGDYLEKTLLIITADHGGHGRAHGSDSPEDMTIPWLAIGPGVPANLTLTGKIVTYDTAATVLYSFKLPIPEEWDGRPVLEIFGELSEP